MEKKLQKELVDKKYYLKLDWSDALFLIEHSHGYYNEEYLSWTSCELAHFYLIQSIVEINPNSDILFLINFDFLSLIIDIMKGTNFYKCNNEQCINLVDYLLLIQNDIVFNNVSSITLAEYEQERINIDLINI